MESSGAKLTGKGSKGKALSEGIFGALFQTLVRLDKSTVPSSLPLLTSIPIFFSNFTEVFCKEKLGFITLYFFSPVYFQLNDVCT